jgi:putative transposase
MPMKRYKPAQTVTLLRQIDVENANGKNTPQAWKEAQRTVQTYYRGRKEFSGLKLDQAKPMKDLEWENAKLKRLVAELSLEKQILKDVTEETSKPRATPGRGRTCAQEAWSERVASVPCVEAGTRRAQSERAMFRGEAGTSSRRQMP